MIKFMLSFLALNRPIYQKEIGIQLVELLYGNLYQSLFALILISSFLVGVLWSVTNHMQLLLWYGLTLLVVLARFMDVREYRKHSDRYDSDTWYQRLCLGVTSSALLWGFMPLLFFVDDQITYNMFITIVIIGLSAGAVTSLAADRRLSHIYLYILIIPLIVELIQQNGLMSSTLVVLTIFFMFFVSSSLRQAHSTLLNVFETQKLYYDTQEKLLESEERHRMMFEQAPTGTFYYDNNFTILECNIALTKIMRMKREELIGLNLKEIEDTRPLNFMENKLTAKISAVYEGPYRTAGNSEDLWVKIQMTPLIDANKKSIGGLAIMEDKTQEHEARKQAEFLSLHDPLTGLPNRKLLKNRLNELVKRDKREKQYSSVLFLDLDKFKEVNDTLGHNVGDQLLKEVAQRIMNILRATDTLSRIGGDEFVILLPLLSAEESIAKDGTTIVSNKIHDRITQPFYLDQNEIFISFSIGIVLINDKLNDTNEILRRADIAMYQAKNAGRNRTYFYDTHMDKEMQDYIQMQHDLRQSIDRNELKLYFQPIFHIDTDEFCAAETLLQWEHNGNLVPLKTFIPVAEESGFIHEIGKWVIENTFSKIREWKKRSIFNLDYLTLNVNAKQVLDPNFATFVIDMLSKYGVNPSDIKFEVKESALIENFDQTKELFEKLEKVGIKLIIDDFGTGYSSISHIKSLPFNTIKIDKILIFDMLENEDYAVLIRAIIDIAHQFDYDVIAQGLKNKIQQQALIDIDNSICIQGILLEDFIELADFESFLFKYSSESV